MELAAREHRRDGEVARSRWRLVRPSWWVEDPPAAGRLRRGGGAEASKAAFPLWALAGGIRQSVRIAATVASVVTVPPLANRGGWLCRESLRRLCQNGDKKSGGSYPQNEEV